MINGYKIANQSGLNKSKTNRGQKQSVVMNNDTRSQAHRQLLSPHYPINAIVQGNGRTSDVPWV